MGSPFSFSGTGQLSESTTQTRAALPSSPLVCAGQAALRVQRPEDVQPREAVPGTGEAPANQPGHVVQAHRRRQEPERRRDEQVAARARVQVQDLALDGLGQGCQEHPGDIDFALLDLSVIGQHDAEQAARVLRAQVVVHVRRQVEGQQRQFPQLQEALRHHAGLAEVGHRPSTK